MTLCLFDEDNGHDEPSRFKYAVVPAQTWIMVPSYNRENRLRNEYNICKPLTLQFLRLSSSSCIDDNIYTNTDSSILRKMCVYNIVVLRSITPSMTLMHMGTGKVQKRSDELSAHHLMRTSLRLISSLERRIFSFPFS